MPVTAVTCGADFVEIKFGGKTIRATEADVAAGSKEKMALAIQALLQKGLSTIQPIADLSDDDDDKTINPKLVKGERMYWGDPDGVEQVDSAKNNQLVSRDTIVKSVDWDGEVYVLTQRRAH